METTNPRAPGSLEASKTALSTSALDEFDSRKIINRPGSPTFGAMSISQKFKPKDDMENLNPLNGFAFRRTSLNPDSSHHDLQSILFSFQISHSCLQDILMIMPETVLRIFSNPKNYTVLVFILDMSWAPCSSSLNCRSHTLL